jgi:peptidoglycan L-alanyl-D-glutamate endopeptidase CwlK
VKEEKSYLSYIVVGVILGGIFYFSRKIDKSNKMINTTWNPKNDERIAKLHPKMRPLATQLINEVESKLGHKLLVVSGLRTFDEQRDIYAQGRTKPGNIVTYAKPGYSYHNYGLAIDVTHIKDGNKPDWSRPITKDIAEIGKKIGLEWGGYWTRPYDPPHFQLTLSKIANLLVLHNSKKVDSEGYVLA